MKWCHLHEEIAMAIARKLVVMAGMCVLGLAAMGPWAGGAEPGTQPASQAAATLPAATQPAVATHVVKKGSLNLDIQTEGVLQPSEQYEVRLKLKGYAGPLTIVTVAQPWAAVKKGDVLLELEQTQMKWGMEGAQTALASAKANQKKVEADAELGAKADALAMRMQEEALKNVEAGKKWWDTVDGPQMLLSADLQLKNARDSVEDQELELGQLQKMYKSEELTNATADIVIKRAVRGLERSRVILKMQEERNSKTKTYDYPIANQRVLDSLEQSRQALASLKVTQEQAGVLRRGGLSGARIAVEQAEEKQDDLKSDIELFTVRSPVDGVVVYGQLTDGAWQGGDPRNMRPDEKLASGQTVMRVFTSGRMKMEVGLSEAQGYWIEPGLKAKVTPAAFPLVPCDAVCGVVAIVPKGNPPSFSFQLSLTLVNADPRLLPGMKATVKIESGKLQNVLLAPIGAMSDGKVTVRAKDGSTQQRDVVVGKSDGLQVEIRSGLAEGEEVVIGKK